MPRGIPIEFEASDFFSHLVGKTVKRKRGQVKYVVVGAREDNTYKYHYNFTRYFIVLKRLSPGSASRPKGSETMVEEYEFQYMFEEV